MTINEAIATIKGERWVCCQEKYIEAINLIENTMRKYQKIQEIVSSKTTRLSYEDGFRQIKEVVEDE